MRALTRWATRGTVIVLAVVFPGAAHADTDTDFLGALTHLGISYQDPAATIHRGRFVCQAVTSGGFTYTETVYGMAKNSGSTIAAENGFAAVAIGYYCHEQEKLVMPAQTAFPPGARITLDR